MTPLPVSFACSPIPSTFEGTPDQFAQALVARLSINASGSLTFYVTGPTAPTYNAGPWLKNGTEWWVWNNTTGAYVPITLDPASLQYTASQLAPDHTVYTFWIKLDSNGNPLGIYYWYSGAWTDVYAQLFSLYSTTEQMNQILANGISAYPCRVVINPNSQTVAIDTNAHKINFSQAPIDPRSCFDNTNLRYVAQVAGVYHCDANYQIDNGTATASGLETQIRIVKNGNFDDTNGLFNGTSVASPPGSRWYPSEMGLIQLGVGDYLEVWMSGNDGVNTGNVTISNGNFCVHLVNS